MTKNRYIATLSLVWLLVVQATAQPLCRVVQYDEEDGIPSSHVTQLLQDTKGFLWFATWNGLCRYDGYEFQTFKSQVGDGCHMTTDRIRDITLLDDGHILCQVDYDYYMFDLHNYRFRDLTADEQQRSVQLARQGRQSRSVQRKPYTWADRHHTRWTLYADGRLTYRQGDADGETDCPLTQPFRTLTFAMADDRGNLWVLDYGSIYKFTTDMQHTRRLDIMPKAEVKCLFCDRRGRCWVATKDDEALRLYGADGQLQGYLGPDGRLHTAYTRFGAAVYCMYETKDGTLWLGTKPKGLFRLQPQGGEAFKIAHFIDIPCADVYHITEDRYGRLWVATLGGGISYTSTPQGDVLRFNVPPGYPQSDGQRARYIHITRDGVMLVATGNGLTVARIEADANKMHFQLHQRNPDRATSLSSSATMDVAENGHGRLFVSTESGGVNEIVTRDLLSRQLDFRHINVANHELPSDMVQSMTMLPDGKLMAVGSHLVCLLDSSGHTRVFDAHYFHADYRFSEAHPAALADGRRIFGLTDGAFAVASDEMSQSSETPRLVLTRASVQGSHSNWAIDWADTLTLQPRERSVTIHFAALDYQAPERISYAFRLTVGSRRDSTVWTHVGHNRSATLLDLQPGTYRFEVHSTNADGEWQQNQRTLTIVVLPTFWESALGRVLLILLVVTIVAAIAYTLLYIRRIKRQQRETLEKYLALMGQPAPAPSRRDAPDPMLQRVMQFVEENIANSDAGVGDMAAAAATSRSGLQRKLKQVMGITPQDLLKEARIKRACQLLRQTDKTVSEVAYACGFTDPKYFSRSFKQSVGQTPSEYKVMSDK